MKKREVNVFPPTSCTVDRSHCEMVGRGIVSDRPKRVGTVNNDNISEDLVHHLGHSATYRSIGYKVI